MIFKGVTDDDSNRAQKRHSQMEYLTINTPKEESGPVLRFGFEDLKGIMTPHNDDLVIRVIVTNYKVAWVFVDADSSVNVLFKLALEQMILNKRDLQYIVTLLFDFSEHAVHRLVKFNYLFL